MFLKHFPQGAQKCRLYRVAAIAIAGLILAIGVIAYHDGNKLRGPLSLKQSSFMEDVPLFRDHAPQVWSESHYPRPGKSDAGDSTAQVVFGL